ncbi:MAG TPA: hypothetical protein DIW64_21830 [Cellvibrio sp.]|nr:hypothetical protein [Cellvibrio sp.]
MSDSAISAEFKLSGKANWYNAGVAIVFDKNANKLVDLTDFNKVTVTLKCSLTNSLYFGLSAHDEKVTQENIPITYRSSGVFINCDTEWREVVVNLDSLEVAPWWLHKFGLKASDNKLYMDKIIRAYLETTYGSPRDVDSMVSISRISFSGQRYNVLVNFFAFASLIWIALAIWTIKFYSSAKQNISEVEQPLSYEQLTFNSVRERDRQAIIDYIAKNFSNPEIDNESVSKAVGVSRTKVNEILKSEYGSTFTNHINKLRVIEASRLLAEKSDAHITEIAYLVGFKNISYFNKLFKEEFGLTPKEVRGKGTQI